MDSLKESITNIIVGCAIAIVSQRVIFYILDKDVTILENIYIFTWMSIVSVARTYTIRRYFNQKGKLK